jgi:enterochelin esterase-like enzyme
MIPFRPLPLDLTRVEYETGPDSAVREDVPAGETVELGQVRVHVPAAYDGTTPANLMIFLDGSGFLDPDDDLRAGVVLDNLTHTGDLPPTIGVFVDPVGDRNAEYDAFDDSLAARLVEEVLPRVADRWSISDDPTRRGIGGFSSSGSAAFTAAWHRPDAFGRVLCLLPSFAQVRGGNPYPDLIATTPAKPVRVLVQQGHRDLGWDEAEDNWLVTNLRMTASLVEAGYDVRLVLGDGAHDANHAGVVLPDALRWLFRD